MDTIAHGLTGGVIGYCGFRQRGGRAALWTSIAAAEFPDIDIVLSVFGAETYLRWHRSVTHSAVMLPAWAALVACVFWGLSGRKNFRLFFFAAVAGMASHLFLDWMTNYGTELLWPFTDARFALSWVFIVDVYVWAVLLVTLIKAMQTQRPAVAKTGLAVVGAFFLCCGIFQFLTLRGQPRGTVAYPQPMNPLRWTVLRADGNVIHWASGRGHDVFLQFRDDRLLPKAEATEVVKLFRWFAAFPLVESIEEDGRTVLRYRDLRFRTPMPWGGAHEGMFVVAKVIFDEHGNILSSRLTSERERR